MKITNGEILNTKVPLQALLTQKMPGLSSLGILDLVQVLNPHLIPVEETQNKLLREYGEVDPNNSRRILINEFILVPDETHEGRMLQVPNPNFEIFTKELGAVLAVEVEVKVKIVNVPSSVEISPVHVMALKKFITIK